MYFVLHLVKTLDLSHTTLGRPAPQPVVHEPVVVKPVTRRTFVQFELMPAARVRRVQLTSHDLQGLHGFTDY